MSQNRYPDPRENDYPIPDNKYNGDLQGGGIRHNSTHWDDDIGHHRESYNYDREGNMENFHDENGPK